MDAGQQSGCYRAGRGPQEKHKGRVVNSVGKQSAGGKNRKPYRKVVKCELNLER